MIQLSHLALTFLKIGAFGFGGPFSLIAIMEKETVERRGWLTAEEFTQSVGIGTLTPGPIFFATAVFVGYRLRGLAGAIVCAVCTLLPSFLLVLAVAALYAQLQTSPIVEATIGGIAAGVVGMLASVVLTTGRSAIDGLLRFAFAALTFTSLAVFRVDPIALIVLSGLAGAWVLRPARPVAGREG